DSPGWTVSIQDRGSTLADPLQACKLCAAADQFAGDWQYASDTDVRVLAPQCRLVAVKGFPHRRRKDARVPGRDLQYVQPLQPEQPVYHESRESDAQLQLRHRGSNQLELRRDHFLAG